MIEPTEEQMGVALTAFETARVSWHVPRDHGNGHWCVMWVEPIKFDLTTPASDQTGTLKRYDFASEREAKEFRSYELLKVVVAAVLEHEHR